MLPKKWPLIIKWTELCKTLRGNKEVYEKFNESVEQFRESL
jgi:hypothetical protein